MKGWSFRGLVEALGTAAFKAVGALKGQVPLVGDRGLLDSAISVSGVNFDSYPFKNNETLLAVAPHYNWPFGLDGDQNFNYLITVLGTWGSSNCIIRMGTADKSTTDLIAVRESGVWRTKNAVQLKVLGGENLNTFNAVHSGIWAQMTTAAATPERGYPINEAGVLEVYPSPYGVTMKYTAYASGRTFNRQTISPSGGWSNWVEDLKTNLKQACNLGWTEAAAVSFPWNNTPNQNTALAKGSRDTLQIDWGVGTIQNSMRRLLNNGGVFATNAVSLAWREVFDNTGKAPYTVELITAGAGSWLPHSSQKVITAGQGYGTAITLGTFLNDKAWPSQLVQFALDSGHNTYYGHNANGTLIYYGGGIFPDKTFADTAYVNAKKDEVVNWTMANFLTSVALGASVRYDYFGLQHVPAGCVLTAVDEQGDGWTFTYYRQMMQHIPSRGWVACGVLG